MNDNEQREWFAKLLLDGDSTAVAAAPMVRCNYSLDIANQVYDGNDVAYIELTARGDKYFVPHIRQYLLIS